MTCDWSQSSDCVHAVVQMLWHGLCVGLLCSDPLVKNQCSLSVH